MRKTFNATKRNDLFGKRRSIFLEGVVHGTQPFPLASRKGPLVTTSAVFGVDPKTGKLPTEATDQIRLAFSNLEKILIVAGGSMDDISQVIVTLSSMKDREAVNKFWCEWFPDPDSRPSRNTTERELPGGAIISLISLAWII